MYTTTDPSGSLTERKVFKNTQVRRLEDLKNDYHGENEKGERKEELQQQKFNSTGEIFKQTSMENSKVNAPRNVYLEQDLGLKYHNNSGGAKSSRNNEPGHQKFYNKNKNYSENNNNNNEIQNSETPVVSKFGEKEQTEEVERPKFVSSKKTEGNFISLAQEGDVSFFIK